MTSRRSFLSRMLLACGTALVLMTILLSMLPAHAHAAEWVEIEGVRYELGFAGEVTGTGSRGGAWRTVGSSLIELADYDGGPIHIEGSILIKVVGNCRVEASVSQRSMDGAETPVAWGIWATQPLGKTGTPRERGGLAIMGDGTLTVAVGESDAAQAFAIYSEGELSIRNANVVVECSVGMPAEDDVLLCGICTENLSMFGSALDVTCHADGGACRCIWLPGEAATAGISRCSVALESSGETLYSEWANVSISDSAVELLSTGGSAVSLTNGIFDISDSSLAAQAGNDMPAIMAREVDLYHEAEDFYVADLEDFGVQTLTTSEGAWSEIMLRRPNGDEHNDPLFYERWVNSLPTCGTPAFEESRRNVLWLHVRVGCLVGFLVVAIIAVILLIRRLSRGQRIRHLDPR